MITNHRMILCDRCNVAFPIKVRVDDLHLYLSDEIKHFSLVGKIAVGHGLKAVKGSWYRHNTRHYCPDCWYLNGKKPYVRGRYSRKRYLLSRLPEWAQEDGRIIYVNGNEKDKYVSYLRKEFNYVVQPYLL